MKKVKNTGSVFGVPQRTIYGYIKFLKNKMKNNTNILIIDDKDGLHSLPFLRQDFKVTMYETENIYIDGGNIDEFNIMGLKKRLLLENKENEIKVMKKNFYETKIEEKYDFVYVYRSLHDKCNKHISMNQKMKKILSSVKENGYVYIFYYIAKNEKDYSNFPKNQYFRKNEIKDYFKKQNWDIISLIENNSDTIHIKHPNHNKIHYHRVGYIFAKKINNRLVYQYKYNIIVS